MSGESAGVRIRIARADNAATIIIVERLLDDVTLLGDAAPPAQAPAPQAPITRHQPPTSNP